MPLSSSPSPPDSPSPANIPSSANLPPQLHTDYNNNNNNNTNTNTNNNNNNPILLQQQQQILLQQQQQQPLQNNALSSSASSSASSSTSTSTSTSASTSTSIFTSQQQQQPKQSVSLKIGLIGDAQIGKTSLMVKYVEGDYDEDYIQTLGVNFMEKTVTIRNTEITFSIWDLGGQREFVNMLPLVSNEAVAILFMFDLTRKSTLNSVKEWYRQARGFNKTAIPFLIGTKFDLFAENMLPDEQDEITRQAKKFAKAMKASLVFCSTSHSINVQKIFKIVLSKAFDLKLTLPELTETGEPILIYQQW
ncbi:uncharacterized protein SAPINGB_P004313 [Magnusiomyces paraingens]|uniref:Septum-promoting GTP-binding protein 1 n=1 Tax=Magnusiomyces paraingens TaxID=2606893 RepID=A0A5E8BW72_9ASCO|nr:uncharacterized protein SAPINGB_P004313 [Saprochaete ingens]VVT54889.1 unnamed protein product [Saprochaete ingens]